MTADRRPAAPVTDADAPAVERQVVSDMIRRSLPALPVLVAVAALFWGVAGALSAAFAIGLVLVNFVVAAALIAGAARISMAVLALAAVGGFIVRLALLTVAVLAVKDQWWVELVPLGFTLIITHLGLLVWEARHVSFSLAFPGLKPAKG
ncbi:MAG TPA: ATP synthase subunit I [Acidimicrobiales bacterium]|nr:ATP synthase subunit I [Acidimicrobiales bacterium]